MNTWLYHGIEHLRRQNAVDSAAAPILLDEQGLLLGLSSGINVAGVLRLAREGGPGQTIVTLLCDSGLKYQSRLFNPEWLAAHQLDPHRSIEAVLDSDDWVHPSLPRCTNRGWRHADKQQFKFFEASIVGQNNLPSRPGAAIIGPKAVTRSPAVWVFGDSTRKVQCIAQAASTA